MFGSFMALLRRTRIAIPSWLRTVQRKLPALLLPHTGQRKSLALLFLLLTAHCSLLTAQDPVDQISIDTDLVNLNVSVYSRNLVPGASTLLQKDFKVFENGEPQEISFFASSEAPFDLVLLLDLSGSTADKIDLIRKSSKQFVDAARPDDRIAIVTFTADVQVAARLTSDHPALKKSIDGIEKPKGGTNFWDALRFVLEHVLGQSRTERRRSAIVVMTDGVDNALPEVLGGGSVTSFEELMQVVQHFDTIVLPIYLDTEKQANFHSTPKSAYALARKQLAMLAAESGNEVYRAKKIKDLEGLYPQVMRSLSTVYSIGYRPTNLARDGSWRNVKIEVNDHPELAVRARRGYFANKQQDDLESGATRIRRGSQKFK
jgi:VWFA-related protein